MVAFLTRLMLVLRAWLKSRVNLEAENLVLRQQLSVRTQGRRAGSDCATSTG
jgi:hypothetical protein